MAIACGDEVASDPYRLSYVHRYQSSLDADDQTYRNFVDVYRFDPARRFLFVAPGGTPNGASRTEIEGPTNDGFAVGARSFVFTRLGKRSNRCGDFVAYSLAAEDENLGNGELECGELEAGE